MAFQDVNTSGTVVVNPLAPTPSSEKSNPKTEADRDEELARSVIEDD